MGRGFLVEMVGRQETPKSGTSNHQVSNFTHMHITWGDFAESSSEGMARILPR